MDTTPIEITKDSAIRFLHEYVLGDSEIRQYLDTYEEVIVVFNDGFFFSTGSLFYRDIEETDEENIKFIDYIVNIHGLDDLVFMCSQTEKLNIFYNGTGKNVNGYNINNLFDFGYSLNEVDLFNRFGGN